MAPVAAPLIGVANLPNQRHKIVSRKGANFTVMVLGESGLGKTTFVNTLFTTLLREYKRPEHRFQKQLERTVQIDVVRAEIEEKGFNVRLTVIDTPGFGDYVNNQDCWVPVVEFLDEQHLNYMHHERRAERREKDDLRVHVCLYFIQPTGHTLKPLDIEVMKQLGSRVNLIPIIAKADTITPGELAVFKDRIRDCLAAHNIAVYSPPVQSDDEDSTRRNQSILSAMPFSVIASESDVVVNGEKVRGRQYLWGVAEVENEAHCDFKKLRNLLIRTHMHDLIASTEEAHYENFRAEKLASEGRTDDDPASRARKQLEGNMKEEEEALRKRFTEQVRLEENRFRQWEQRLIAERDRLNRDLETQHKQVKALEEEIDELNAQRRK
ncbi:Septin-domain-containing protein [Fimicolochytrium jonesii]|uniref:Septin-domain-containing protein n=1 Tax=Fimicolochytrium jonesii TaxID=1396493 RepID=UPI0022FEBE6C|nr:Septin-domain-containing protein [Fimicolochytrium jonesii]KAI8821707.1 Septin-domain-containing protein [Fimicolochytrium jonesii]